MAELAGLRVSDISFDDPHPHILLYPNEFRGIKSGTARHVPILDALLALGFREFVEGAKAKGSDRIFPEWEKPKSGKWANAKWIKAFNRTVIPAVFPELASREKKSPVVFHSFRGAFKVLMLNAGKRHLANAVIGHTQDDLDKSYIGLISPAETYAEFKAEDFVGLRVPSRCVLKARSVQVHAS